MEVLVERGASKADCCHKITEKYGIYFSILKERKIPKRFFGIVPEQYEVEFVLNPWNYKPSADPRYAEKKSPAPALKSKNDDATLDFEQEKIKLIKSAGKDPEKVFQKVQEQDNSQQVIIDKLNELDKKIDTAKKPEHPALARIMELLKLNDFSDGYINKILERARKELSLDILENFNLLQNRILEWIGESIKIYEIPEKSEYDGFSNFASIRAGRIMVLIGPTGVGKTTTIAKLAAIYGIKSSTPLSIRMITIDAFRIGARDQIKKFGEIMEIPISYVDKRDDLRKEIDLYTEDTDLILVDTFGRSPRDTTKLGEMQKFLEVCGSRAEVHLVISAATKTSDLENILRQFEPFNYQAVLLTKFDETSHTGNIISALADRDKPLSYITDGQIVPKDIKKASVIKLLSSLEEFRVDWDEIEKRFPASQADQFLWG